MLWLHDLEAGRALHRVCLSRAVSVLAATSGVAWAGAGEQVYRIHGLGGRVIGTHALGSAVVDIVTSPDGMWAVALGANGDVVAIRAATGRERLTLRVSDAQALRFLDDQRVSIRGDGGWRSLRLPSGKWDAHPPMDDLPPAETLAVRGLGGALELAHPSGVARVRIDGEGAVWVDVGTAPTNETPPGS